MKSKIRLYLFLLITLSMFACANSSFDDEQLTPEMEEKVMVQCDLIYEDLISRNADTLGTISKIPKTMNECYFALDTIFTDDLKEWVICLPPNQFGAKMHFGVGLYMRNNWALWKGGKLASYLESKGFEHPDNMSGIILYLYHRKLQGKEYDMDKFVEFLKKEEEKYNGEMEKSE